MTNMIFFFKYGNEYGKQIFILYFKLYFIFYSYLINEIEHIVMFELRNQGAREECTDISFKGPHPQSRFPRG